MHVPAVVTTVSLLHEVPLGVHMHDAVHHLAAIAQIRGHAGGVQVVVWVRFGNWRVHGGVCSRSRILKCVMGTHRYTCRVSLQQPAQGCATDCGL